MNKEEIDDLEHTIGLQGITREAVTIEIEKDQGTVNIVHVWITLWMYECTVPCSVTILLLSYDSWHSIGVGMICNVVGGGELMTIADEVCKKFPPSF